MLDRARILLAKDHDGTTVGAGAIAGGSKGAMPGGSRTGPLKCWECGGPHPARYCPSNKKEKMMRCWRCGGPHLARVCTEREAASCQMEKVRGC